MVQLTTEGQLRAPIAGQLHLRINSNLFFFDQLKPFFQYRTHATGKEVMQPTIEDVGSFKIWAKEAFELWKSDWAASYEVRLGGAGG